MTPNARLIAAMEAFIEARCRATSRPVFEGPSRAPFDLSGELAERIGALGLEAHVVQLRDLGYTVVSGAGDSAAEPLRAAALAAERMGGPILDGDPVWVRVIADPVALALVEAVVGRGALLSSLDLAVRRAGDPCPAPYCEQEWWPAPFPDHPQLVTVCWVTDDGSSSILEGPVAVAEGSHRLRRHPTVREAEAEGTFRPIVATRGSLVVWRGETWIGRYPRLLGGEAVSAVARYTRLCCRPKEDFSACATEEWLAGKPAALRTLLGLDDMLGKRRSRSAALKASTLQAARG